MIAVRDHLDQFGDAVVAIVTFAEPARLAAYRTHLQIPFTLVADTERVLYRAVGAERGALHRVWSPATMRRYAQLLHRGRRLTRPTEDTRQLGADAVVGRDGRVRYLALPRTPADRPPVAELIAALD